MKKFDKHYAGIYTFLFVCSSSFILAEQVNNNIFRWIMIVPYILCMWYTLFVPILVTIILLLVLLFFTFKSQWKTQTHKIFMILYPLCAVVIVFLCIENREMLSSMLSA